MGFWTRVLFESQHLQDNTHQAAWNALNYDDVNQSNKNNKLLYVNFLMAFFNCISHIL